MEFELTEEQRLFREMARDFATKEVAPQAQRTDEGGAFPYELVKKLGELGFMGIAVPKEYGGVGADTVCYVLTLEEISRACTSTGVIMSVNNSLVCEPILRFGTEEQKRRYLTPLASGKFLGCFALSEPNAGSDVANQQTVARNEGESYILNGIKNFTTNGLEADVAIVFAVFDRRFGHKGITAFLVEKGTPGFRVAKVEKKLGIKGSSCVQLLLDHVRVPKENLLGREGKGSKVLMTTLDSGRIAVAAQAVGIAQAALDMAADYAKRRVQFGQPIASFQALQFMLADMAVEIEAARLLTYRAALLKDKGVRYTKEAAMAKLFASEMAMRAAIKGVQILEGYGYMMDYPAQRYFRDAKITEIYEGTSEIQRLVIAKHLLESRRGSSDFA